MRVWPAAVLLLLAVAGCGVFGDDAEREAAVEAEDLAVMVLPQKELGAAVQGLEIDAEESGPISAKEEARSTVDPKDTASAIRRGGWLTGYELTYSNPKRTAAAVGAGMLSAGTSVDLFETDSAARALLVKEVRDLSDMDGRKIDGVTFEDVHTFEADVGEEGWVIVYTVSAGKVQLHLSGIYFRRGRVLGSGGYLRFDDAVLRTEAISLGQKLDERIQRRLAGELNESPVPLPARPETSGRKERKSRERAALDPKRFTLTAQDLPAGAIVTGEGYRRHGDVRSYLREFRLPGGRLGASRISYFRAMAQVLESPESADDLMAYSETFTGSRELTRLVARQALKVRPGDILAGPLPTHERDTIAIVAYFGPRTNRLSAVMLLVRVGRVVGSVTAAGRGNEVNPKYVVALAPKLRAQLRSAR